MTTHKRPGFLMKPSEMGLYQMIDFGGSKGVTGLDESLNEPQRLPYRRYRVRKHHCIAVLALVAVTLMGVIWNFNTDQRIAREFSMQDVFAGKFRVTEQTFNFIESPYPLSQATDGGLHFVYEAGHLIAKKLADNTFSKTLTDLRMGEIQVTNVQPNYYLDKVILGGNIENLYRHSSVGTYWMREVGSTGGAEIARANFAHWSPRYQSIVYAQDNNLYLFNIDSLKSTQITNDGSPNVFNGIADWVYEEEILGQSEAYWFSANDEHLAFLKIDDSGVPDYHIEHFVNQGQSPSVMDIKYPAVGQSNPQVGVWVYNLQDGTLMNILAKGDYLVYDVHWVGASLLIKTTDRESKKMMIYEYNAAARELLMVREYENLWIEKQKKMLTIGTGYADIMPVNGYNHIVYFPDVRDSQGVVLTSGDFEVTGFVGFEHDTSEIIYTSNEASPMSQHIYSVTLEGAKLSYQVPSRNTEWYELELTDSCLFGKLRYKGPDTPYTIVGNLNKIMNEEGIRISTDSSLKNSLAEIDLPSKYYHQMQTSDGLHLSVIETRPFDFNPSKKYPLLVNVYGGPGSQTFTSKFSMDFEDVMVSQLNCIVLEIETRGTGAKGWDFRAWVKHRLGYWEPRDVVDITKQYLEKNKFIDPKRTCVWGWSYGGFVTLKTLEYDSGNVFKFGMAVAPVTDWQLYDSVYTERYMDLPEKNTEGYEQFSKIRDYSNFTNVERFFIMHGTADDNVHIQNTYRFLDGLDLQKLDNYDVHIFPDSDHSISLHGPNLVFNRLKKWLERAFS